MTRVIVFIAQSVVCILQPEFKIRLVCLVRMGLNVELNVDIGHAVIRDGKREN